MQSDDLTSNCARSLLSFGYDQIGFNEKVEPALVNLSGRDGSKPFAFSCKTRIFRLSKYASFNTLGSPRSKSSFSFSSSASMLSGEGIGGACITGRVGFMNENGSSLSILDAGRNCAMTFRIAEERSFIEVTVVRMDAICSNSSFGKPTDVDSTAGSSFLA